MEAAVVWVVDGADVVGVVGVLSLCHNGSWAHILRTGLVSILLIPLTIAYQSCEMERLHIFIELHLVEVLIDVGILHILRQYKWLQQKPIKNFLICFLVFSGLIGVRIIVMISIPNKIICIRFLIRVDRAVTYADNISLRVVVVIGLVMQKCVLHYHVSAFLVLL